MDTQKNIDQLITQEAKKGKATTTKKQTGTPSITRSP